MDADVPMDQISYETSQVKFAALRWGSADHPLALCLHGYPDTAWTWRYLGPYLAGRGWHVVAPFLRGYAPTSLAADNGYAIGALVRDTIDAHRQFARGERSVLIGHDWGAITAYATGAYQPQLFHRIVTLAVPPLPALRQAVRSPAHVAAALRQLRYSWYAMFQQLPVLPERMLPAIIPRLWAAWSPGYDASVDVEYLQQTLADPRRPKAILAYYREFAQPWKRHGRYASEQAHWNGVPTVPVMYLNGQTDGCLNAALVKSPLEVLASGSRHETVPSAGHFLHLERPEHVNQLMGSFLGSG